jgi:hypothetical protein
MVPAEQLAEAVECDALVAELPSLETSCSSGVRFIWTPIFRRVRANGTSSLLRNGGVRALSVHDHLRLSGIGKAARSPVPRWLINFGALVGPFNVGQR